MFKFDEEFTKAISEKIVNGVQGEFALLAVDDEDEAVFAFQHTGACYKLPINDPSALDWLKKSVASIDVDGGAITGHKCDDKGLRIGYITDSAKDGQREEIVEVKYPFAIYRTEGAYALNIIQL